MKTDLIRKRETCRACEGKQLTKVFSLGPTPLANAFLTLDKVEKEEYYYPLDVYFCPSCSMLQLGHVVNPEVLFGNYVYVSSTSNVFITHFREFADHVVKKLRLNKKSFVIDIGSNDGILLHPFKKLNCKVLGIEPAKKIAEIAQKSGIETISDFFSIALSKKIVKQKGNADLVTATNVFAHIDDLNEVIYGLQILLNTNGVFIIEAPYLIDFLKKRYFDLVYHEHLSYWSVTSLSKIFSRFGMHIFDVEKTDVHGGSIRVYVQKNTGNHTKTSKVSDYISEEKKEGLLLIDTYVTYNNDILDNRNKLLNLLTDLKRKGKTIGAYGAPAKGNTLLNFFGIGTELIDFVVDDSTWKQNLYTPGKRIPVVSSEVIYEKKPDYLLILAWNFADSIVKIHKRYKNQGGKFIIPVPIPKIL